MPSLYEILMPFYYTKEKSYADWTTLVTSKTNGLTVGQPCCGTWLDSDKSIIETVLPVRIACDEYTMSEIAKAAKTMFNQKEIMYYCITRDVYFI